MHVLEDAYTGSDCGGKGKNFSNSEEKGEFGKVWGVGEGKKGTGGGMY